MSASEDRAGVTPDAAPSIQDRLRRHTQFWPHAEVCLEAADALDCAEAAYNTLREGLEELCAGSEPMILAWEDPANPIAAPVECVAVIDLRALLSKDGNDGT